MEAGKKTSSLGADVKALAAAIESRHLAAPMPDDSPSKENLMMMARTASIELDDLVVDVDTQDLRSPGKSPPGKSPPGKSPVQVRAIVALVPSVLDLVPHAEAAEQIVCWCRNASRPGVRKVSASPTHRSCNEPRRSASK